MKNLIDSDKSPKEIIEELSSSKKQISEVRIMDRDEFQRANGLINTRDRVALLKAVDNMEKELANEGFDPGIGQKIAIEILQQEYGEVH